MKHDNTNMSCHSDEEEADSLGIKRMRRWSPANAPQASSSASRPFKSPFRVGDDGPSSPFSSSSSSRLFDDGSEDKENSVPAPQASPKDGGASSLLGSDRFVKRTQVALSDLFSAPSPPREGVRGRVLPAMGSPVRVDGGGLRRGRGQLLIPTLGSKSATVGRTNIFGTEKAVEPSSNTQRQNQTSTSGRNGPSPQHPPSLRLRPQKKTSGLKRRDAPLPSFPFCDADMDYDSRLTLGVELARPAPLASSAATFLSDDVGRSDPARSPFPSDPSQSPFPTPNTSGTAHCSPREIKSPHWSKPVPVNPFSPIPAQYLTADSNDSSFESAGSCMDGQEGASMYYSLRGSPIRRRRRRYRTGNVGPSAPPKTNRPARRSSPVLETSTAPYGSCSLYGAARGGGLTKREGGEDSSPMDVTGFPYLQQSAPPPKPIKGKSTFPFRRSFNDEENDGGGRCGGTTSTHHGIGQDPEALGRKVGGGFSPRLEKVVAPQSRTSRFEEDFQVIGQLGSGSFGTVYKCISRVDGCLYAVKAVKREARGELERRNMLKEVYALAALCSQADTSAFHIVRYQQAWMEDNRLYIQTELCTSTLQREMVQDLLDDKRRYKLLRELLLALELIHKNDMVHLDIKPENIFVKNDQFKLGDFGLASKSTCNKDIEEGDARYMSKELLSGDYKDLTKCDIFSLGATMYEVCLGRCLPSHGDEWHSIRSGTLSPALRGTLPDLRGLICEMIQPNPTDRPHATEMLRRRQLLSDEKKALIAEQNRAMEASRALAIQEERFKAFSTGQPRTTKLMRSASCKL